MPARRPTNLAATLSAAVVVATLTLGAGPAAPDRAGYYHPEITSEEVFARRMGPTLATASRAMRVGFVTELTRSQLAAPETPRFVIFAKGAEADHMIILALDDEVFATLYRARAVLAQLTAQARTTDFFLNSGIESQATWFDLAKILGFSDLVISDGRSWAHRVDFDN